MLVDSHVHVDEVRALGWLHGPEVILGLMDRAGIARAGIMTYRDAPASGEDPCEYTAACVARFPDRFVGYVRLHPWYGQEAMALLERAVHDYGFRGVKLHPVTAVAHPAGAETVRLVRRAGELGVPVLFHCGDEPMTTPLEVEAAAAAAPETTVILAHMGGYFHADQAIAVAGRRDNVILDTSAIPHPLLIRQAVKEVGDSRVVFASDGPGCDPALEVLKVRRARLGEAAERKVFAANILRIWGRS